MGPSIGSMRVWRAAHGQGCCCDRDGGEAVRRVWHCIHCARCRASGREVQEDAPGEEVVEEKTEESLAECVIDGDFI
jgi:hypothetical protein